ncbi:uncharacterized protein LOC126743657 [Anthonomus grandis grandis]|uniref:uncharacterized protein LOC126743657 n=1 Tax=Anthonomus grandis grandis TaxID=2921223 RepID=UPI00216517D5|nr:uncharacterized protein LOC126743657 [Anthonomus grandis grandis]
MQCEKDNFQQLRAILQNLSQLQTTFINKNQVKDSAVLSIEEHVKTVSSMEHFKALDQSQFDKTIKKVQADFDNVMLTEELLVPSVWTLSNNSDVKVSLQVSSRENRVPPVLDALLYIFSLSTESFRQKYFKELIKTYYEFLMQQLASLHSNASDKITDLYMDLQVRILLPVAKIILVSEYHNSKQVSSELLNNLANYFQYPLIHQEEVYEVVCKKLDSTDFHLVSYKLVSLSEKNGHLGEYYYLKVVLQEETLDFFCKFLLASTEYLREIIETRNIGKKENFFYGTLYPLFQKYGLEKLLDFAPKCYLRGISGYMVLDNLTELGYSTPEVNTVLNLDGLKAVLDKLAKFHACSFITEERLSEESGRQVSLYDIYERDLAEKLWTYEGTMADLMDRNISNFTYVLNKFPDLVEELNMSPEVFQEAIKDFLYSILFISKMPGSRRKVVNHGDLYVGNTLIKYGPDNLVIDGKLIDFQVVRYLSPAYEMMFFIHLTSTKETRTKHLKYLLDWYYDTLRKYLEEFGLDLHKIYSKQDFEKDVYEMKPIAVAMAFAYGHTTLMDTDIRKEVIFDQEKFDYYMENQRDELTDLCWKSEKYKEMMRGLMTDSVDLLKNGFRWDRSLLGIKGL